MLQKESTVQGGTALIRLQKEIFAQILVYAMGTGVHNAIGTQNSQ